ncbi:MAG: hypothetical protein LBM00_04970 [Deltaproteobacteria bacterium]|jgi:hypothetical protein|nr:hypothetical protein [Deltaproteobacteria bacterium]
MNRQFLLSRLRLAALSLGLIALIVAPRPADSAQAAPRVAHVLVSLCDNEYQGIVPVPPALGNGSDPDKNLYWGAAYGLKTFMRKQPEWKLLGREANPAPRILERLVFRHDNPPAFLVADAYEGRYIKETVLDFLTYAAGQGNRPVTAGGLTIQAGGSAGLLVYIGHNGLMDFPLTAMGTPVGGPEAAPRQAAVFACLSRTFFEPLLRHAGAEPYILTTGLMCPEAYTTHALLRSWLRNDSPAAAREAVAAAYNKYQKCGLAGARRLFWTDVQAF